MPMSYIQQPMGELFDEESVQLKTRLAQVIAERDVLAKQVTGFVKDAQAFHELRQRAAYAQVLAETAQAINATGDLTSALDVALTQLIAGLGAIAGEIFLLNDAQTHLTLLVAHTSGTTRHPPIPPVLPLTDLVRTQQALDTGLPVFSGIHERPPAIAEILRVLDIRSSFIIPLIAGSIHLGVAYIQYTDPTYTPDNATCTFAQAMGIQCALALHKARLIETAQTEQARLRAILDIAPLDIAVWDRNGQLMLSNDHYNVHARFGLPRNLPYDERVKDYSFRMEDEDGNLFDPLNYPLARAIRGETVPPTFVRFVFPDDSRLEYIAIAQPSSDGQSIVGIYQDVGPLRAALADASTAHAAAAGLAQANTLKNQFIALVAHELRTPLTGMRGFAELLALRDLPATVVKDYAGKILFSTARMQTLLDEYLDIQRLEAGAEEFHSAWVDIPTVVQEAVADVPPNRTVNMAVAEVGAVWVDATKLRRVLDNLLSNALKYSPPPTPITVRVSPQTDAVLIEIEDQGTGIPALAQPRIFEKFFRVRSLDMVHSQPGTGLGLAISREIVTRMGGYIGFDSSPTGTTFWIRLPITDTAL